MSKIISVHSFRGGTGKSNLTANLAATAAERGLKVGVVDTDIQSPGIHVIFGMDEGKIALSLNDYLWGKCGIADAAYDVTPTLRSQSPDLDARGSVFFIPSSIRAGEIARILRDGYDVGLLSEGFHDLFSTLGLDVLFIDTHPGINEETLLSIAISDVLLLILRPDRQDFQGTAVTVEVAKKLGVQNMYLVVNKVLSLMDRDSLKEQVEATYQASVAGMFPLSEEMLQLASEGVFCLRYPDHPFTREVRRVTDLILS
jgi:MinD-like ATPase involved in chromosome partitioning or flagellar assembly